jgi:PST family polysaccharide transporter
MIAVAPEFINVLYGKSWEPSITVTRVLMLVGIIHSSFFFFGNTLKAFGKPGWRFSFLTLVGFLNVLGFYLTVRLGIVAIASSYAIIGYLTFPIYFKLVSKVIRIDLRTYIYHWAPALIASIVMCVVIMGLRYALSPVLELHLQLSLYILAGALTYLIVIGLLQPLLFKSIINLARMAFSAKGPRRTDSPQGLGK